MKAEGIVSCSKSAHPQYRPVHRHACACDASCVPPRVPQVFKKINGKFEETMAGIYKVSGLSLGNSLLFQGWDMGVLEGLAGRMQPVLFSPDTVIYVKDKSEAADGQALYVISKVAPAGAGQSCGKEEGGGTRRVGSQNRRTVEPPTPRNHQHIPQCTDCWAPLPRKRHHKGTGAAAAVRARRPGAARGGTNG